LLSILTLLCAVAVPTLPAKARIQQPLYMFHVGIPAETTRTPDPGKVEPGNELYPRTTYSSDQMELSIYINSPEGEKLPAVVFVAGGFPPGGFAEAGGWLAPDSNDQSAKVYRQAGFVTAYPSFRGSNGNPGTQESFHGEVRDVVNAVAHVAALPNVDPERVYLIGHSTGGTLVLLAAEYGMKARAVVSFGPVPMGVSYGPDAVNFDVGDEQQVVVRSPVFFLDTIEVPTTLIEGKAGNVEALKMLSGSTTNDLITGIAVKGADHFDVLHPMHLALVEAFQKGEDRLSADADKRWVETTR